VRQMIRKMIPDVGFAVLSVPAFHTTDVTDDSLRSHDDVDWRFTDTTHMLRELC
jgi:hypothetical protein